MSRISPLHPDDAPEEARIVLKGFFDARGNVPNMFRTLARRPAIMKTASDHMAAIFTDSLVEPKILELVSVRVSILNGCKY
jgi:alkylhydroperoxidase family enzyme